MASVVAARDEKEKERRDASVNLRARPRASSVLPRAPVRAELSLEKLVFQDKISPLVGCRAGRRDFAPDFATCSSMRTKSGPTYPVSKWKTVEDEPPCPLVWGARRVGALQIWLFGSAAVSARAAFYRRFALKSVRLRRPRPQPGTPRSGSWPCTLVRHRPLSSKANVRRFTRHPPVTAAARRGSIRNPPPNNKPPPLLINLST